MRTVIAAATIIAASLALPASASVATVTASRGDMADCKRKLERSYSKAHRKVVRRLGKGAAGRDIRRRGTRFNDRTFVTPCAFLRVARGQLRKLLVQKTYLGVRAVKPGLPPAGVKVRTFYPVGLADCIAYHESRYNPLASNGSHWGIGQWTIEAWLRHGGGRFGGHPFDATYQEQLLILDRGLRLYGCRDWCPFDPC